jgi:hypothetical protein
LNGFSQIPRVRRGSYTTLVCSAKCTKDLRLKISICVLAATSPRSGRAPDSAPRSRCHRSPASARRRSATSRKGVIPQDATQRRLASCLAQALGEPVTKDSIWTRPRRPQARRRTPSQRLQHALELARADAPAAAARQNLPPEYDPFLYGVAWAVVRSQNAFATPDVVAEKARLAVLRG